jgi:hypothetical protein
MQKIDLNDYIMDILQDIIEIESIMKVLKDSANNENNEIEMIDVGNTLEIMITKMSNVKYSLNKYINLSFS